MGIPSRVYTTVKGDQNFKTERERERERERGREAGVHDGEV